MVDRKQFFIKQGLWGLFYLLVIIVATTPLMKGLPNPTSGVHINQMTFTAAAGADTEARPLPDNWRHNSSTNDAQGTYSQDFILEEEPENLWAVFISTHRSNASIIINDIYIGDGGAFEPILARNYMHPLLLSIPQGVLRKGHNHIIVTLHAAPAGHGFLDPIFIGPHAELRTIYSWHYLFLQTFTQIITFAMLVMGIVMLTIWLYRRHETAYGLLAGLGLTWALHNVNHITSEIPVPLPVWEKVMHLGSLWTPIFGCFFVSQYYLRQTDKRWPRFRRWNWIYAISISILVSVLPMSLFYKVFYIAAMPYYAALLLYMLGHMLAISARTNTVEARLLTAVTLLGMLYAGHDALITTGIIQSHVYYVAPYFGFVSFMFFGWTLLTRFIETAKSLENTNATLSERIAKREAELKTAFEKQKDYEQRALMEQERERLMRDIHDGLGGQLVSILSIVEQENTKSDQVASAVRSALDDLRLIVNSLDIHNLTLPALLGLFRERILSRYEKAGLAVHWDIDPVQPTADFTPKKALHVLRILQEATTNTQKYAHATKISVSLKETTEGDIPIITLIYSDNGIGFDMSAKRHGYGLKNMMSRAADADIPLSIDSALSKGTRIIMRF